MNQTTNFTQWKNLTDEQKTGFDFVNYEYEHQRSDSTAWTRKSAKFIEVHDYVYRLKIQPGKWYYTENSEMDEEGAVITGDITGNLAGYYTLRPATAAEIPKPKNLEDRVKAEYADFDVVMLEWTDNAAPDVNYLQIKTGDEEFELHTAAQSMRGFFYYIYFQDEEFYTRDSPSYNGLQPIAALFNKGINNER